MLTDNARQLLAFALDYPELELAREAARLVGPQVGTLKLGLELFSRAGPAAAGLAHAQGCQLFLDLKLHDIPSTVSGAVAAACAHGARWLTLHAAGGPAMLEAARARVEREATGLELLAVTVLTSLSAADLRATGVPQSPAEQALRLGQLALSAGAHGLVCSVQEAARLRATLGAGPVLVTPGIRHSTSARGDQRRTGSPAEALAAGSDLLVVGRLIRDAPDPAASAAALQQEVNTSLVQLRAQGGQG